MYREMYLVDRTILVLGNGLGGESSRAHVRVASSSHGIQRCHVGGVHLPQWCRSSRRFVATSLEPKLQAWDAALDGSDCGGGYLYRPLVEPSEPRSGRLILRWTVVAV